MIREIKNKKVLVVDDYKGTSIAISSMFKIFGYETKYCLKALDAIDSIKNDFFDYIFLDIIINGDDHDGIDLYYVIKEFSPESIVLFMTGCDPDSKYAQQALKLAPVIFKEFSLKSLSLEIEKGKYDSFKVCDYDEDLIRKINNIEQEKEYAYA